MRVIGTLLLLLLLPALIQCQSKKASGGSTGGSTPSYGNPNGTWKKSCFLSGSDYTEETITITNTSFTNEIVSYSTDSTCTTKASTLTIGTSFLVEGASATLSNTYDATLTLNTMNLVVHTTALAAAFNAGSVCATNWVAGEAKSVFSCTAISSPAAGTNLYYIYQVDDTTTPRKLFIGDGIAYPVNTSDRATSLATVAHIEQSN